MAYLALDFFDGGPMSFEECFTPHNRGIIPAYLPGTKNFNRIEILSNCTLMASRFSAPVSASSLPASESERGKEYIVGY